MDPGIIFGIITLFFFGISVIFKRKLIEEVGVYSSLVYSYFTEVILLLFFFFVFAPKNTTISLGSKGLILLLGIIGALGITTFHKALTLGNTSVIATLGKTSIVITVLLSLIFLKESLSTMQMVGVAIAILGTLITSSKHYSIRKKKVAPAIPYTLITIFSWGFFFFLYKYLIVKIHPITATLLIEGSILGIFILFLPFFQIAKLTKNSLKNALLSGFAVGIGAISYNLGIAQSNVSIVAPVASADPIITVIAAWFLLSEKLEKHHLFGIITTIIGIILLSL